MTSDKKMGQSEVRDFDSFFCQTVMRKTIGANWTRVIKHVQLLYVIGSIFSCKVTRADQSLFRIKTSLGFENLSLVYFSC